jgi:environmental stress-induced protein Ves
MSVQMRIARRSDYRTIAWKGGETTELAIFPPSSQYAARDFEWRVSSATVTSETSEFTRLPGYSRHLLVLAGELRLQSAEGWETLLRPGEQCSFRGDTPITSYGLATDFNLMIGPGWDGGLTHIVLDPGERRAWRPADTVQHALVYCGQGQVSIAPANSRTHNLDAGDLMWATSRAGCLGSFDIVSHRNTQSTVVFVTVADEQIPS